MLFSLCVCCMHMHQLFGCMSVCLFTMYRSVCLHICLSVFLLISLSVYLISSLNVYVYVLLVCCLSIVYLYLFPLSVRQYTYQSECVSICLSIWKYRHGYFRLSVLQQISMKMNVCPHVLCIEMHICVGVFLMFVCMSICTCACICVCLHMGSIRWYVSDKHAGRHMYWQKGKCTCKQIDR